MSTLIETISKPFKRSEMDTQSQIVDKAKKMVESLIENPNSKYYVDKDAKSLTILNESKNIKVLVSNNEKIVVIVDNVLVDNYNVGDLVIGGLIGYALKHSESVYKRELNGILTDRLTTINNVLNNVTESDE